MICAEGDTGFIYDGLLETEVTEVTRGEMPAIKTKIMMNVGNPQLAFDFCQLPNAGVGLARLEFIINNNIGVHPKAILDYPSIDADLKKAVESVARGHASPRAFYVDKVAEGASLDGLPVTLAHARVSNLITHLVQLEVNLRAALGFTYRFNKGKTGNVPKRKTGAADDEKNRVNTGE